MALFAVGSFTEHAPRSDVPTWKQVASRGEVVPAVDLRGRGKSDGKRFRIEDVADYVADLRSLRHSAKERHPGLPISCLDTAPEAPDAAFSA